jgi:uroporphyrinogen decarboxylase
VRITPRERVLRILAREPVDRPAVDLWLTPEAAEDLRRHTGSATDLEMYRALGLDKLVWVFPRLRDAPPGRTTWGAPVRSVQAGAAHYEEFGEAPMRDVASPEDLDGYPWWPDPDGYDYEEALARARAAAEDFAVLGPWVSLFEVYCQLRGLEQGLMDLILSPDLVDAVLDRVEAIQTGLMERWFEAGARECVDLAFLSDDMGTQAGLLISPEMWRRHLEPRMRRWCDLVHSYGLRVLYHSDGAVGELIGPLADCGIDVLNPIQHACPGMDPATLKAEHGHRLIFHGGVDNQRVLPFGSPDDVRAEVRMLRETLGAGGEGFIGCSCHNVQAGTPVENVLAMVDEMTREGCP